MPAERPVLIRWPPVPPADCDLQRPVSALRPASPKWEKSCGIVDIEQVAVEPLRGLTNWLNDGRESASRVGNRSAVHAEPKADQFAG